MFQAAFSVIKQLIVHDGLDITFSVRYHITQWFKLSSITVVCLSFLQQNNLGCDIISMIYSKRVQWALMNSFISHTHIYIVWWQIKKKLEMQSISPITFCCLHHCLSDNIALASIACIYLISYQSLPGPLHRSFCRSSCCDRHSCQYRSTWSYIPPSHNR